MKTVIYTNMNNNFNNNKNKISDLIFGIILVIVSFLGLFMGSKLILKLVTYIIPILILLYSIRLYKLSFYFKNKDIKKFLTFFSQAIVLTITAIYVLIFPLESLNYLIIVIGLLLIINSFNTIFISGARTISFLPFLLGIICVLFSDTIINTFYTLFLIIIMFIGVTKLTNYFIRKKRTFLD